MNEEKNQLNMYQRVILLIVLVFAFNTTYAQQALKIYKSDNTITYINISAVDSIKFEAPLAIGDTYQGGIIFYLDASGEHGLIAAPSDQSAAAPWYHGSSSIAPTTGATGDSVGAGMENVYLIVKNQGVGSYAASICGDLTIDGYNDWYLPSKYELNLLYEENNAVGGFANAYYWSSTESNASDAWRQDFTDGLQYYDNKNNTEYVRAIRAF